MHDDDNCHHVSCRTASPYFPNTPPVQAAAINGMSKMFCPPRSAATVDKLNLVTLTLPALISANEGMISNLINSEAFATYGSRCIVATAVILPSFAWYEMNYGRYPSVFLRFGVRRTRRLTHLQFVWTTVVVDIIEAAAGAKISQTFAYGGPEDGDFGVCDEVVRSCDIVRDFPTLRIAH